jgi:hypothetical protein
MLGGRAICSVPGMSDTQARTTDHDTIRNWAQARGGKPAAVRDTGSDDDPGLIRLMFPDAPQSDDDRLEEISWDDFFEKFDQSNLALIYQEKTADGQESSFNKLVSRN